MTMRDGKSDRKSLIEEFEPATFFVLRTPLLPLKYYKMFLEIPEYDVNTRNPEMHETNLKELQKLVAYIDRNPQIREALLLASSSLTERVYEQTVKARDAKKLRLSVAKYLIRMITRTTPFGLFAGVTYGSVQDAHTNIELTTKSQYRRHVKLDTECLVSIVENILKEPLASREMRFYPNTSLYLVASKYRYVRRIKTNREREFALSATPRTEYLNAVLNVAKDGATLEKLTETVSQIAAVDHEEAGDYINELVSDGILVSELEPNISGEEPFVHLCNRVVRSRTLERIVPKLLQIRDNLSLLNRTTPGSHISIYSDCYNILKSIGTNFNSARLFHVDLYKPASVAILNKNAAKRILKVANTLYPIYATQNVMLAEYTKRFAARYEGQEVPLLFALDEENGVPFKAVNDVAPLIEGLDLNQDHAATELESEGQFEQFLLQCWSDSMISGSNVVELRSKDLEVYNSGVKESLGYGFYVVCDFHGPVDGTALEESFKIALKSVGGVSGIELFGRFCHGDTQICDAVRRTCEFEAEYFANALVAEVVHLPNARTANVTSRPILRDNEIVYHGATDAAVSSRIDLSDLVLYVKNGRLRLKSASKQKDVIPRLTTAHNFSDRSNLNIYQLLCHLQADHSRSFGFHWPSALRDASFVPRVEIDGIIVSPARWTISVAQLTGVLSDSSTDPEAFQRFRSLLRLPKVVTIPEADQGLTLDLDSELCLDILLDESHGKKRIVVEESLLFATGTVVKEAKECFAHEIVLPYFRQASSPRQFCAQPASSSTSASLQSDAFFPGSEWMYVKIYCGTNTVDEILVILGRFLDTHQDLVGNWFFVRYGDPEWHLRLRIRLPGAKRQTAIYNEIFSLVLPYRQSGSIHKIQFDTYIQETARYGGRHCIESCERYFSLDSSIVIRALSLVGVELREEDRWKIALVGIDFMIRDFNFNLAERTQFMATLAKRMATDQGFNKRTRIAVGAKFRENSDDVHKMLTGTECENVIKGVRNLFLERSLATEDAIRRIQHLAEMNLLSIGVSEILDSLIHMFANRILKSSHRAQEAVLYDFLYRYYFSLQSRVVA